MGRRCERGARRRWVARLGLVALACGPRAGALLGCAAGEEITRGPELLPPQGGVFHDPQPVVAGASDELLPASAPLGNRIVYAAKRSGNLDIYVRELDATSARRLTTHSTDDTDPALSNDGRRIAWVAQAEDVKGDIWVMNADGGDPKQLTDRRTIDRAPVWSADGQRVFFTTREPGTPRDRIDAVDVDSGVRTTAVDEGWDAAPLPDGSTLCYVAHDDRSQPRLYLRDLRTGRIAALTDGSSIEGLPRVTQAGGRTVIVFTRFVDDQSGDGVADSRDPSSLWAVDYTPTVFTEGTPAAARPLTTSAGSEIFAAPVGDWLFFTARGFSDLDIYALPIDGIIDREAGPQTVLEAARAEERPLVRRLALRYLIATTPSLEGQARYEVARDLAEQQRWTDAIEALRRVTEVAAGTDLGVVAALELVRLEILQRLRGELIIRDPAHADFVRARGERVRELAAGAPGSLGVLTRAENIGAEVDYALGNRTTAVATLESIANRPEVASRAELAEDGARALDRLAQIYADLRDLHAVERVTVRMLEVFGGERSTARRASRRWVERARDNEEVPALAALEHIVGRYAHLPIAAAQAARAQALVLTGAGREEAAQARWRSIVADYPGERDVRAEALLVLAELAERGGRAADALDAFERLLADYPEDAALRTRARQGITRIALDDAQRVEARARAADAGERPGLLRQAYELYDRLLRADPELVIAHRRLISLAAQLGILAPVLARYEREAEQRPRDKVGRYAYAYARLHQRPVDLAEAADDLEDILTLDERFVAALVSLGWVYERLEEEDPGQGHLEQAFKRYELAGRIAQRETATSPTDADLLAATQLNKGNALAALGKTDLAFREYLARELSGVPFDSPLTEAVFRERFARVALQEGALAVALDQASAAFRITERRKGPVAALLGALYLHIALVDRQRIDRNSFHEALDWYTRAAELYAERGDTSRMIPLLRGQSLALQGLGRFDEALAKQSRLLGILARGGGPGQPQPPDSQALISTEVPAVSSDVTRARWGFNDSQEEEIARAASGRIYRAWGDTDLALRFNVQRLALLKAEVEQATGERIRLELLAALHESALLHYHSGSPGQAVEDWTAALGLLRELGAWSNAPVILEALSELRLRGAVTPWPPELDDLTLTAARDGRAATADQAPEVSRRLARWLSLEHLRRATARTAPREGAGFASVVADLDAAVDELREAHELALASDRPELEAHLAGYLGLATSTGAPADPGGPGPGGAAEPARAAGGEGDARAPAPDPVPGGPSGAAASPPGTSPTPPGDAAATRGHDAVRDNAEKPGSTETEVAPRAPAAGDSTGAAPATALTSEPPAPPSDRGDWRAAFDRYLWQGGSTSDDAGRELDLALTRFETQATSAGAIELGAFAAAAAGRLLAAGDRGRAWHVLERERLLRLRPPASRVRREPVASAWSALRERRGTPEYAAALEAAPPLVGALEGRPASLAAVAASLEGDAMLLQAFAPTPEGWHWFCVAGPEHLRHAQSGPMQGGALPDEVAGWLADGCGAGAVATVYVDTGELWARAAAELLSGGRPLAERAEVVEVVSASYLVAAHAARNLSRHGSEVLFAGQGIERRLAGGEVAGGESTGDERDERGTPDDDVPAVQRVSPRRAMVHVALAARAGNTGGWRAGHAQVILGPTSASNAGARLDLDQIAAAALDANLVLFDEAPKGEAPNGPRAMRALAQALLVAGVPSFAICDAAAACGDARNALAAYQAERRLSAATTGGGLPTSLRVGGYRGMTPDGRVDYAIGEYKRLEVALVNAFKTASRTGLPGDWHIAEEALVPFLDVAAFLEHPDRRDVLKKKDADVAEKLPGRKILGLTLLSRAYQGQNQFLASAQTQLGLLAILEASGNAATVAAQLLELGKTYAAAERDQQASDAFARCAETARGTDQDLAADCTSRRGTILRDLRDYPGAIAAYEAATRGYAALGSPNEAYPRRYLGFLYEDVSNDYGAALEQFTLAIAAARRAPGSKLGKDDQAKLVALVPSLHLDVARIHAAGGAYDRALEEVSRASELLENSSELERSDAILEAAKIYWYRGNYRRALERQRESLALALEAARNPKLANAAGYREIQARSLAGLIALAQGELDAGERSLRDALRLARQTSRRAEEAKQLNNLGVLMLEAGRIGEAVANYREALAIEESLQNAVGRAYALRGLGVALHRQGRLEQALETVNSALALSREVGNSYNELRCLYARAEILHAMNDPAAGDAYRETTSLARRTLVPELEWRSLYASGRLAEARGDVRAARAIYDEALGVAERLGRGASEGTAELSRDDLYSDAVRLAAQGGELDAAFAYTERARARSFLDVLASISLPLPDARAKELLERELRTREARIAAEREAPRDPSAAPVATAGPPPAGAGATPGAATSTREAAPTTSTVEAGATTSAAQPAAATSAVQPAAATSADQPSAATSAPQAAAQAVEAAAAEHAAALAELRAAFPQLARILTISPVDLEDLRATLAPGVVVLDYFVGRDGITVLATDAAGTRTRQLVLSREDLRERVARLRTGLATFAPVDGLLEELSASILLPLREELAGHDTVVVIPDGELHNVPFAALPIDGEPLLKTAVIAQAPSASILYDQLSRAAPRRPATVAAFAPADDLPFARLQARAVANGGSWVGPEATEERFTVQRADAVDVAAHGRLDPRDPMSSAILFAPGRDGDARLEVREVFGLGALPPLVTLSACDTAGSAVGGAAWVSLGNAFLTAGARSVIASRTRVSDLAAAMTMKQFYRAVRELPTGRALQQAALRSRAYYRHPAHWAAFVLIGDYR